MFWGLVLEPGKRYSQQVGKAFHISMATLETSNSPDPDHVNVPVMLEYEDGKEYLLCTLSKAKSIQCPLDLNFREGEKIGFYSAGGHTKVHLTGYLLEELDNDMLSEEEEEEDELEVSQENTGKKRKESLGNKAGGKKIKLTEAFDEIEEEEDEDDSDYEGVGEEDDNDVTEEAEDEEDDDDDDDDDDEEEDSDELDTPKAKTEKPQQVKTPNEKKAGKGPENKKDAGKTPVKQQNGQVQTPGSQKKNKKPGETPKQGTPQKSFNKSGVDIVETVVGNGPVAKPGTKVAVYYIGRLKNNNKQFDATTSGAGFKFTLGRNEVIKGWDIGVVGMHVGGKRTITIPPHLAYGKRGQPPVIPPQSTLVFDIELKNVF